MFYGQCWFLSPCPQSSPGLIRPAGAPRRNSGVIWKAGGEHVCLLFLRRNGCRVKTSLPQSERDKSLSGKVRVSACSVCVCVCVVCVGTRERETERQRLACPHRRLIASTEKLSFLFSIRELSLYFCPNHLQRPQENATLELRSGSPHTHTLITVITTLCHQQSSKTSNPHPYNNFFKLTRTDWSAFHKQRHYGYCDCDCPPSTLRTITRHVPKLALVGPC